MTETILNISSFAHVISNGNKPTGALFVDADSLIKFQKTDSLDTLLAANRIVYVTPEVFNDAVTKGLSSSNSAVVTSAQKIDQWIQSGAASGLVNKDPVDQLGPLLPKPTLAKNLFWQMWLTLEGRLIQLLFLMIIFWH